MYNIAGDTDWFYFESNGEGTVSIAIDDQDIQDPYMSFDIRVYDPNNQQVASGTGSMPTGITFPVTSGRYSVKITASDQGSTRYYLHVSSAITGGSEIVSTAKKYYLKDHHAGSRTGLGSTRRVVDASGSLLESYDYYPFGLVRNSSVSGEGTKETFTGKEKDDETGFYYFGSRYYNPALAGWMATDPAGQFHSPYSYGNGNPVMGVDPDGEFFVEALTIASIAYTVFNSGKAMYQGAKYGGVDGFFQAFFQSAFSIGVSMVTGGIAPVGGESMGAVLVNSSVQYGINTSTQSWAYGQDFSESFDLKSYGFSVGSSLAYYGAGKIDAGIATHKLSKIEKKIGIICLIKK